MGRLHMDPFSITHSFFDSFSPHDQLLAENPLEIFQNKVQILRTAVNRVLEIRNGAGGRQQEEVKTEV
jgi:hypothetical protein